MSQLPYPLDFMHKFNLHKWLGLIVADDDIPSIARIYGVRPAELRKVERRFQENVARLAARLPAGDRNPAVGASRPSHPASPLTLLALGDSISSDRESYGKILNQYWRGSRKVIDCAISGNTTSSLLDRLYDTVMNQQFDWIVIFIGTNDCRQLDDRVRLPIISLHDYQRNLEYLTDLFRENGKQVVLVTIPPADNKRFGEFLPGTRRNYDLAHIAAANQVVRGIASRKGVKLADLAAAIEAQSEDVLAPDGLHMNDTGHLILCRLLLDLIP